jgi:3-isopropylmalate dehydrogenase
VSQLWRERVTALGKEYPDVELSHMYVDNAAMQLIRAPKQVCGLALHDAECEASSFKKLILQGSVSPVRKASLTGVSTVSGEGVKRRF